jgi:hypothetical protein
VIAADDRLADPVRLRGGTCGRRSGRPGRPSFRTRRGKRRRGNDRPSREKVLGKFGITALPGPNGPGSSSLGGANLAISAYSRHQHMLEQAINSAQPRPAITNYDQASLAISSAVYETLTRQKKPQQALRKWPGS